MSNRYFEEVNIVGIKPLDIQEITASIKIKVKKNELKCFVSDLKDKGPFSVGEKCTVILSLMTWPVSLTKIKEKKKEVKTEERKGTPNHCILSGEIVDFRPIIESYYDVKKGSYYTKEDVDHKAGIVDCGVFVAVEIPKDSDLKVGDYIKAEGRLDAQKIKE